MRKKKTRTKNFITLRAVPVDLIVYFYILVCLHQLTSTVSLWRHFRNTNMELCKRGNICAVSSNYSEDILSSALSCVWRPDISAGRTTSGGGRFAFAGCAELLLLRSAPPLLLVGGRRRVSFPALRLFYGWAKRGIVSMGRLDGPLGRPAPGFVDAKAFDSSKAAKGNAGAMRVPPWRKRKPPSGEPRRRCSHPRRPRPTLRSSLRASPPRSSPAALPASLRRRCTPASSAAPAPSSAPRTSPTASAPHTPASAPHRPPSQSCALPPPSLTCSRTTSSCRRSSAPASWRTRAGCSTGCLTGTRSPTTPCSPATSPARFRMRRSVSSTP